MSKFIRFYSPPRRVGGRKRPLKVHILSPEGEEKDMPTVNCGLWVSESDEVVTEYPEADLCSACSKGDQR